METKHLIFGAAIGYVIGGLTMAAWVVIACGAVPIIQDFRRGIIAIIQDMQWKTKAAAEQKDKTE